MKVRLLFVLVAIAVAMGQITALEGRRRCNGTESISDGGMVVPPSRGVATAINFQPTSAGKSAITDDFVLIGKEVNPPYQA